MDELGGSIWSAAVLLFLLMDPLGNIPLVLSVLKGIPAKRQRVIIARELLMALALLLLFLFLGKPLLRFLHLQQEAVTISGGLILLIIGLRMIFPKPEGIMGHQPGGEPFLVPIAIPMIAGPSVLAMLILMTQSGPAKMTNWFFAVLLAWGMSAVILLAAPILLRFLKERGLIAVERLMGMLLVMVAVQMLIDGFEVLFQA
ncbi:MarC family protein [Zeaxanthinibacter sp. PT1]|uniref:MarC family protein n=1 Tax=Zeaxanthinibacter TaxID=561554 RepID=UPI00234B0E14|nr:MarC family protein [Zeaxanthinibacter sp. PT1]MDC6350894.1 MarC family protein [Zeaxanthinibacter sp. PT1]